MTVEFIKKENRIDIYDEQTSIINLWVAVRKIGSISYCAGKRAYYYHPHWWTRGTRAEQMVKIAKYMEELV